MVALKKLVLYTSLFFLFSSLSAQEVLLPLQSGPVASQAVKAADTALALPFFDDFATGAVTPMPSLWLNGGATTGFGAGLRPPTVGVVTLDAIDATGHLYPDAVSTLFSADTLQSRHIRLDGLAAADSVVLSFYYLPGGGKGNLWERIGDTPQQQDSIFLDFYRPVDSTWVTVWCRGGTTVDSLIAATGREWQYVTVAVTDNAFFDSLFCFRFRNYCSLPSVTKPGMAGNCDYWHLDYILLDKNRVSVGDPVFRDVAFVDPAPSMLKVYQAMPARQYLPTDMADTLRMTITNLFSSALATQYRYAVVDEQGDTLYRYNGGYENTPPFLPDGSYQTAAAHATPPVGYVFPEDSVARSYMVVHMVREGVAGDDSQNNDTVRFYQVFDNYFAYDDGTAENGYGLTSTASRLYLAYRFDLNKRDTLTAVKIYFNRALEGQNEFVPFNLTVWDNDGSRPGSVLYRDHTSRMPVMEGLDRYHSYELEQPVVVEGSVFIGFEQGNNYFINLGFDRHNNTSDRIWYLTGTSWQQSILSGSLMIRPCFGPSATMGIEERIMKRMEWCVFPNPASGWVRVEGLPEGSRIEIYDALGRRCLQTSDVQIDTHSLPSGVYVMRCVSPHGLSGIKKLIVRH